MTLKLSHLKFYLRLTSISPVTTSGFTRCCVTGASLDMRDPSAGLHTTCKVCKKVKAVCKVGSLLSRLLQVLTSAIVLLEPG
jgi:hypothetical protein